MSFHGSNGSVIDQMPLSKKSGEDLAEAEVCFQRRHCHFYWVWIKESNGHTTHDSSQLQITDHMLKKYICRPLNWTIAYYVDSIWNQYRRTLWLIFNKQVFASIFLNNKRKDIINNQTYVWL